MDFYNRLNYSLGNEDWSTEAQALRIQPNDRVICVTASGDRPLHLLMTECSEIISIDMNHVQNYLLELKLAAITQLSYGQYIEFLGCKPTNNRYKIFKNLRSQLSQDAINFWEKNKKMIDRGIIYQGKVERLASLTAKFFNLLKNKQIKKLFSFVDMDSQRQFISAHWDTPLWRKVFYHGLNPNLMKILINDPGVISYIDSAIDPGRYIYQKKIAYLNNYLAKTSPLLQLLFTGKISPDAYFPYMTEEGYYKIRRDTSRLKHFTTNIIEYMNDQTHKKYFDCFSMSDIASYMPQDKFIHLLKGMHLSANSNARFCLRKLMCGHSIPEELAHVFQRNFHLEQKLENEESNFVYRFMVGKILKQQFN